MRFSKAIGLAMLAAVLAFASSAWSQEKPFTQQQVLDMVRAHLGNDEGAKQIMARGIDFDPTPWFLKKLKSAGAKDVFLKALRGDQPLSKAEIDHMVQATLADDSGAQMVTRRGLNFTPTEAYIQGLKAAGAKDSFVRAVRDKIPMNQV